jgi:hypothetical protein
MRVGIFGALCVTLLLPGCDDTDSSKRMIAENGNSIRMLSVGADVKPDSMMDAARSECEDQTDCFVYIWIKPDSAPKAWPFLEREDMSMAFEYRLKRRANFERGFWDCRRFKRPVDQCRSN